MKIVFIGAGNLATHLAQATCRLEHQVVQIYSRTADSARSLAEKVNARHTCDIQSIDEGADLYIFSVKDSVLETLIEQMPHASGLWVHTAGSMPCHIFQKRVPDYGVIYPMQTFSKERKVEWTDIPIFTEGSSISAEEKIGKLARQLSTNIYPLSSEKRIYIHTAAVFACNFVNHLYEQAEELTKEANIPFETLLPLIRETCAKVHQMPPHDAQTGPAVRFDTNVMQKHIDILKDDDSAEIYKLISQSIYNRFDKERL